VALLDSVIVTDGACSADLGERVVGTIKAGGSRRAVARLFRISASSPIRCAQRVRASGSCAARPIGGDVCSRNIETHQDWLLARVDAEPDLTRNWSAVPLGSVRAMLTLRHDVVVVPHRDSA